jgi:hypothetical protein
MAQGTCQLVSFLNPRLHANPCLPASASPDWPIMACYRCLSASDPSTWSVLYPTDPIPPLRALLQPWVGIGLKRRPNYSSSRVPHPMPQTRIAVARPSTMKRANPPPVQFAIASLSPFQPTLAAEVISVVLVVSIISPSFFSLSQSLQLASS